MDDCEILRAMYRVGEKGLTRDRKTRGYKMAMSIAAGARMSGPGTMKCQQNVSGEWIPATQRYDNSRLDLSVFRSGFSREGIKVK